MQLLLLLLLPVSVAIGNVVKPANRTNSIDIVSPGTLRLNINECGPHIVGGLSLMYLL